MNWLKNRQPKLWREKQQIEHTSDMIVMMDLNGGDAGKNETGKRAELDKDDFDDWEDVDDEPETDE